MSRIISSKYRAATIAAFVLLLASLALTACGGSSSSSTASTTANAAATTQAAGSQPAGSKRFTAIRECLQKNGITLPKRTPGQSPQGGFLGAGGGPQLPKGVTRAQYEAAVKKCGGFGGGRFGPGGAAGRAAGRFNSPAFKTALTKFASCMRENGVNVPAPNTSGKGPIFNTSGLNPTSAKFRTAQVKCASVLRSAFKAQPGAAGAPPAG